MVELIGFNDQLNSIIKNYKSSSLHNSIIFYGPKGVGKKTFINKFLYEILKINFENSNYIHHLNLLNNNSHPNIKLIEKTYDNKIKKIRSQITIDQIRNIKKFVNESSAIKQFNKFVIIDSADDLNKNSSNALLKTLEEPNKNTYIFLLSHQLSNLIPTIRSRCLKIKLEKHKYENFKLILQNQISDITEDEISFFYELSYGCPGNAITLYDNNILEILDNTINTLGSNKIDNNSIELINSLSKLDNDKFKSYLSVLKSILVILNKFKIHDYNSNNYYSDKIHSLRKIANLISHQIIIDRFEFLSNNESDLFTYNLDKKLFMMRFLSS